MIDHRHWIVACICLVSTALPAEAVTMYLSKPTGNQNVYILTATTNGNEDNTPPPPWASVTTALFDFNMSPTTPISTVDRINGYCFEPLQSISTADFTTAKAFNIVDLADVTNLNMSQKVLIERLWAGAYNTARGSNTGVAAFQYVLWDIIQDVPTAGRINLTAGLVQLRRDGQQSQTTNQVYNIANTWANNLNNGVWTAQKTDLLVAQNPTLQDIVFDLQTPEPGTVGLMLGGAMLLFALHRRKVKQP